MSESLFQSSPIFRAAKRLRKSGESKLSPFRGVKHTVVNDTVGGRPIAVTYCPLCRSVLVFDRKIGGEVREFGVSGLLYNSNVLLYDRLHVLVCPERHAAGHPGV